MTLPDQNCEFYNNLDLSFDKAWDLIESGAGKRTSPAHTPVLGTVNPDGDPQMRVMVLRQADRRSRLLRFHTDARSTKIEEVGSESSASVLVYDPNEKLQIRLTGELAVSGSEADIDASWQASTPFARRCYLASAAPGTRSDVATSGLPSWIEGKQPDEAQLADARQNFAVLRFETRSLELLYLANAGHRRARWEWCPTAGQWSGNWLVP